MPEGVKVIRLFAALTMVAAFGATGTGVLAAPATARGKFDRVLQQRSAAGAGISRVIVRLTSRAPRGAAKALLQQLGGTPGRALPLINSQVGFLPNQALAALAASPLVEHISTDRLAIGTMERTAAVIGAASVRETLGLDGTGVGVAILDSGITGWHDDLTGAPEDAQRVDRFVDFVGARDAAYDDYGHGTHVAGIVAGNGLDSSGTRSGVAPGARLTILKVLDQDGRGYVSDLIAALDYVVANKDALNIRIANLSVSAAAYESYDVDPLTLAAKQAVKAGVIVIAAAGNAGRNAAGATVYGSIGAPGNAPWVLTVGASSHAGTVDRADDSVAAFSSRGPGMGGSAAKPDLVAPGVGIVSLSDPYSALYTARAPFLLSGTVPTTYQPYLSLSGTSMSTPVVSGTVALMLQANPRLTPNQVKAILQYTAQSYPGYDQLTQGAGFLNAKGAVELARYFADTSGGPAPADAQWSTRIIWGNHLVAGGRLRADANAWPTSVTWGDITTDDGTAIEWGVKEATVTSVVDSVETVVSPWSVSSESRNVVWGVTCGGDDCDGPWNPQAVSGASSFDETVVWGMDIGDETVVWGMDFGGDTVVWGMSCVETLCEPIIWSER
jgi:serine protease AprX